MPIKKPDHPNAVDKFGQAVVPGAYIAYGHNLGRCAALRIGKVLAITWKKETRYDYSIGEHGEHVTKLVPHFSVWGVEETWEGKLEPCMKRGTLQFHDRLLVLPKRMVPVEYLAILEPITLETKGTTYEQRRERDAAAV